MISNTGPIYSDSKYEDESYIEALVLGYGLLDFSSDSFSIKDWINYQDTCNDYLNDLVNGGWFDSVDRLITPECI